MASVGFGLCLAPVVSVATTGVAPGETGTASGLLNSSRQIGASLGLAALGTAAQHRTGTVPTPETLTNGYALGLTLCAALLAAATLIAVIVLRRTDRAPASAPVPDDEVLVLSSGRGTAHAVHPGRPGGAGVVSFAARRRRRIGNRLQSCASPCAR